MCLGQLIRTIKSKVDECDFDNCLSGVPIFNTYFEFSTRFYVPTLNSKILYINQGISKH